MELPSHLSGRARLLLGLAVVVLATGSTLVVGALSGSFGTGGRQSTTMTACSDPIVPGSVVEVTLFDQGGMVLGPEPMMASLQVGPSTVDSGTVSLVVHNHGYLKHEVLVMPLPADGAGTRSVGSRGTVDEAGSLGEASRSCGDGAGNGIGPGGTGWVTLKLRPGRYELLCDEPWHYAAGMFNVLTVT
jgi:uncharacterized cupredoxin-like copper-binding protein